MWPHAPEHADAECPATCASRADIRREAEWVRLHHPRHVPTLVFCAIVAFEAREPEEAAILLDQALEIQTSHPEAAILRSRIALAEGGVPFAQRLLQKQILLRPDHAGLREALAAVHFASKHWEEAALELESARRLGAPDARISYNHGVIAELRGDPAEAARLYRRALSSHPHPPQAGARLRAIELGLEGLSRAR